MTHLDRFNPPGCLAELSDDDAAAWHDEVHQIFGRFTERFPQLYNPTVDETPDDVRRVHIKWTAFPAQLLRSASTEEQRWELADNNRALQDEYCEWSVERDDEGAITRVTFTSEVREYFNHIAERNPAQLLELYHKLVGPEVTLDDLILEQGAYAFANRWNFSTTGRLAHLGQVNNNLTAALALVAEATVPRHDENGLITSPGALARCAGLGNPFRNSDPQIAAIVNAVAREGDEVTLADPVGLYIDGLATVGMQTPDGADAARFWTVERGSETHTLRARYEVPEELGYRVGDITISGEVVRFGAQLADRVTVRITAIVKPSDHKPEAQPCQ